ncbi:AbiV family abortive infection protein [Halalkalibacter alkaliphilus]|uniref:AbiV family abortive infection protein n=1 Tax=Halalkalibacter alkaliphilus TaxID=2917993 RepID=A0A9X2I6S9_9BACI|nr:AbiV family abortive infection protein [Halalkalibacter alkaliphilus]MCL7747340.1 AbiV family abortive infection protein [Halalkalibacter alkaliphilus]
MSFNQLKVEEIEKIFSKIHGNASELLEEAELLYDYQKYARSYLCAHIAFEEFGKLPMLNTAALNVYNGVKTDWKYLNKRIRNHHRKISQSWGTIMMFREILNKFETYSKQSGENDNDSLDADFNYIKEFKAFLDSDNFFTTLDFIKYMEELEITEQIKQKYSMSMLLNEYKNGSLYADFDEGIFLKPSEKIDKEICEFGLSNALIQKKFIDIPNIHKEGFRLYRLTDEHNQWLNALNNKYKAQFEKLKLK